MKTLKIFGLLIGLSLLTVQAFANSPESVVREYYANMQNNVSQNYDLFASSQSCVMAYGKNNIIKADSYSTARNFIQWAKSEKQWKHVIENLKTVKSDGNICAVIVKGHTESWRVDFNSVITLAYINDNWKIVSIIQENN